MSAPIRVRSADYVTTDRAPKIDDHFLQGLFTNSRMMRRKVLHLATRPSVESCSKLLLWSDSGPLTQKSIETYTE